MGPIAVLFPLIVALASAEISSKIGINYGQLGSNLPSPTRSVELLRSMGAGGVKLYNADREVLTLLSGTKLLASIMVPNQELSSISSNQTRADQWVRQNVLPFYPETQIRFLLVGNEILSYNYSDRDRQNWLDLVPAMRRIKASLKAHHITKIKIGTPLAMDAVEMTFPPSSGRFRSDIVGSVMKPLLDFLNRTRSFLFLDVYPYFSWSANPTQISLDYALFRGNRSYMDPSTGLSYTNLLDQMLDSVIFATSKLGFPTVRLAISETGWPNAGDLDQPGANVYNAATYNRNLIKKMKAKPPIGTPARPGVVIPTFIFSLYDEDQKDGPGIERHWGMLDCDGRPIYELDLEGRRSESKSNYQRLTGPRKSSPHKGKMWCVAAHGANATELGQAVAHVCSRGRGTCDALGPGKSCYEPLSPARHASYAFSSYWVRFRKEGANCHFGGLAVQTTKDPSSGPCKFPSVEV